MNNSHWAAMAVQSRKQKLVWKPPRPLQRL